MSYTIFIATPTALIPQPGRAVNTFPSGLVRVDQTYLGLTSQSATHRATLAVGNDMPDGDSSPCIDGLKIFPEVQERRREDGFTEYIVSAYGRVNSTGQKTVGEELIATIAKSTIFYSIDETEELPNRSMESYADTLTWQFCAPKNSPVAVSINDVANVFELNGNQMQTMTFEEFLARFFPTLLTQPQGTGYFLTNSPKSVVFNLSSVTTNIVGVKTDYYGSINLPSVQFQVESIKKTNFGSFDEWTVSYKPYQPTFDFNSQGRYYTNPDPFGSASLDNLIDNTLSNASLGEVWALNTTTSGLGYSPGADYSQLVLDTWITTPTGRAKLEVGNVYAGSVVDGYKITAEFGYYIPNSLGTGTVFTPFARPAGGTWNGLGSGPQNTITQGAATWEVELGPDIGGSTPMYNYVYNLKAPTTNSRALYMAFRWEQNILEDGVTTTFEKTGQAIYEPEVLVPLY